MENIELILKENEGLKLDLKTLQAELEAAKKAFDDQVAFNGELVNENAALKAEVARLLDTPDAEEKVSGVGQPFELEGKKYQVLAAGIVIPGMGKLTANDVLTNEEAQLWLVVNKSGFIRELK